MSSHATVHPTLRRISTHRPMHDVPRFLLHLLTHPAILLVSAFLLLGSSLSDVLIEDRFSLPVDALVYLATVVPAGFLTHFLTSPCSVDESRLLARVADNDRHAGSYVRAWIAPARTPSTVEFQLVRSYLLAHGRALDDPLFSASPGA